jgi:DNA-binding response OmpR family regulator
MRLGKNVGANQYLTKPASREALIAALRDASYQSVPPAPSDEVIVLKEHNVALLNKLEDKNADLEETVQKLERAHERIVELSKANVELRAAPAQVKPPAG